MDKLQHPIVTKSKYYRAVVIDIETLGQHPNGLITQIGMAVFNQDHLLGSHEWNINLDGYPEEAKQNMDFSTIKWWMNQLYKTSPTKHGKPDWILEETEIILWHPWNALSDLVLKIHEAKNLVPSMELELWAHPPAFDLSILSYWSKKYLASDIFSGFQYKHFDSKTFKQLGFFDDDIVNPTKHDALSDAIYTAKQIQDIRKTFVRMWQNT